MLDPEHGRAAEQVTGEGAGMDRPLPASHPGHEIRPGLFVREWPSKYLTPLVETGLRLYEWHRQGLRLVDAPVLHWPYPLVQAMERCALEWRLKESAHG